MMMMVKRFTVAEGKTIMCLMWLNVDWQLNRLRHLNTEYKIKTTGVNSKKVCCVLTSFKHE